MSQIPDHLKHFFADKELLRQAMAAVNHRTGFVAIPGATAEQAQLRMIASGIRPEDNIFTCLLYKMRDGEDEG